MIDSPNAGYNEIILDLQSKLSDDDIKTMYILLFGVSNLYCSYKILKEGD